MRSVALAFFHLFLCCDYRRVESFSISATPRATAGMASAAKKAKSGDDVPSALAEHAVAWASTNGLGMVVNDDNGLFTSTHLPFSLLPYGED